MSNTPVDDLMAQAAERSIYGYLPSKPAAITFIVIFAISTIIHVAQASARRQWFLFPTAIFCGALEVLGWAGRLWSHYDVQLDAPFKIQIVATIVGPTPLLAANFVIFGRIIRLLGTGYSRLGPRYYTIIFCTCDVASLFVQAAGGAIAGAATTLEGANKGGNVMLGGIIFQLAVIVSYFCLALEYFIRYKSDKPLRAEGEQQGYSARGELTKNIKIMLAGLSFNTLCLFIRAIYRSIELADGWNGRIIRTEVYFNVLDGAMVVFAIYTFNFIHPGCFLSEKPKDISKEEQ